MTSSLFQFLKWEMDRAPQEGGYRKEEKEREKGRASEREREREVENAHASDWRDQEGMNNKQRVVKKISIVRGREELAQFSSPSSGTDS